jgi:hypothetical protein
MLLTRELLLLFICLPQALCAIHTVTVLYVPISCHQTEIQCMTSGQNIKTAASLSKEAALWDTVMHIASSMYVGNRGSTTETFVRK